MINLLIFRCIAAFLFWFAMSCLAEYAGKGAPVPSPLIVMSLMLFVLAAIVWTFGDMK